MSIFDEPAFPSIPIHENLDPSYDKGMSLRDYFAARVMTSFLELYDKGESWEEHLEGVAECSYEVADAMLKAREAK